MDSRGGGREAIVHEVGWGEVGWGGIIYCDRNIIASCSKSAIVAGIHGILRHIHYPIASDCQTLLQCDPRALVALGNHGILRGNSKASPALHDNMDSKIK